MLKQSLRMVAATAMLIGWSSLAFAHSPYVECTKEAPEIVCKGGFTDGSGVAGVTVDLISYDEEIIASKAFDEQSNVHFQPYDGEFYILMDAGPGHTVEVEWNEIK